MGMEIERKFLIKDAADIPFEFSAYQHKTIEQGYTSTSPVIRVRLADDKCILTIKGEGLMAREEHELPLTKEAYDKLRDKADGIIIAKSRYLIPLSDITDAPEYSALTLELDIFGGLHQGLIIAEIEFPTEELANSFAPPAWLNNDVTDDGRYHNSYLSMNPMPK